MESENPDASVRPTVMVLLGCFRTGVEAMGPNQSFLGMARALSDRFRFRVVAEAVAGDRAGEWTENAEGIQRLPLEKGVAGARGLRRTLRLTPYDLLISNGFFDRQFTLPLLLQRRLGLVPPKPVLIAPRGEFSPGALTISKGRKRAYLSAVKRLRLLDGDLAIQATSPTEADEIRAGLPFYRGRYFVTPNVRTLGPMPSYLPRASGAPLRVAFLSRIDRKKNLLFALDVLAEAQVPVVFSIYGPPQQAEYWAQCQSRIATLPGHVEVDYRGPVPQAEIPSALAAQDLFFLPTLGENFGHAIVDALAAGAPALLSDQTPWLGLEAANAGWSLPLEDRDPFVAAVRHMAHLSEDAHRAMRAQARRFVEERLGHAVAATATANAFYAMIQGHSGD